MLITVCEQGRNTLADNTKKAKIKSGFKSALFQYQDQEVGINAARILKQNENALEIQEDNDNDELLDVELYRTSPLELEIKTKLTCYLKLLVMERETNIYHY